MTSKKKKPGPVGRERVSVLVRLEPDALLLLDELAETFGSSRSLLMERILSAVARGCRGWNRDDVVDALADLVEELHDHHGGYAWVDDGNGSKPTSKRSGSGVLYDLMSRIL